LFTPPATLLSADEAGLIALKTSDLKKKALLPEPIVS
jgi:hypothetical protein